MNADTERARDYAALFTAIDAGDTNAWRRYVPDDGQAHRSRDEMVLDGHLVVRRENGRWDVVEPAAVGSA